MACHEEYCTEYKPQLILEQAALLRRIDGLALFMGSDQFKSLPDDEQNRIRLQFGIMGEYWDTLQLRIKFCD